MMGQETKKSWVVQLYYKPMQWRKKAAYTEGNRHKLFYALNIVSSLAYLADFTRSQNKVGICEWLL